MIIAIDFDGTIVEDNYPQIGTIKPFAVAVIQHLRKCGHYLILNTCRSGDQLQDAFDFCLKNEMLFDRINDNHPDLTSKYGVTRKIYADVYIDDHNLGGMCGWSMVPYIINLHAEKHKNIKHG